MKLIGNLLWFLTGGWILFLSWTFVGIFWCITIIGIPVGIQCFKMAGLGLWPFEKRVIVSNKTISVLVNILWILFGGLQLAMLFLVIGVFFCATLIGIPFGLQFFKMSKLAIMPFGAIVY